MEVDFFNALVEDRLTSGMSYVEFLCHIHRQIQNKFS
jgi:protein transport protein SEC24